jgi:hypothetical protein
MSDGDDDIEFVRQKFDELMKIRPKRPWNNRSIRSELPEFAGPFPSDLDSSLKLRLLNKFSQLNEISGMYAYGSIYWHRQPILDEEAKDILNGLKREGKIGDDEWNRATWQRIIRRAADGTLECVGPKPVYFALATAGISSLVVSGSAGIVTVFENPFNLLYVLPLAIYSGVVFGILGRWFYHLAWGHRNLAKRIRFYCPHLNLRLII